MSEQFRLIFTGQLLKGRDPLRACPAIARVLGLSPNEVKAWLVHKERQVVASQLALEEAKRLRMALAAAGAVTVIEAQQPAPAPTLPPVAEAEPPPPKGRGPAWPWLQQFLPLRSRWLLTPAMALAATLSAAVVIAHALLLLFVLFGLIIPSLTSSWLGESFGSPLLGLVLQLLMITLGLLAIPLLLKPLLSVRLPRYRGLALVPEQEPDLYAFIEDVCERGQLPMPHLIYLETMPRIEASYYQGPAGFFQNRIVLKLGVPLVSGLDSSQLASLIAQALNRFRGKYLPRANSMVLATQSWLQRALHEPDVVDDRLHTWQAQGRIGEGFSRLLERYLGLARWPLLLWMGMGQLIAHRPVHRLVADADKMALAFCGTAGFVPQLERVRLLQHANQQTMQGLRAHWEGGHSLPDDLVKVLMQQVARYPATMGQRLRDQQRRRYRSQAWLAPCDTLRLARVAQQRIQGSYTCRSAATSLFSHYDKLTRWMTLRYYHHELNLPVTRQQLQLSMPAGVAAKQRISRAFLGLYQGYPVTSLKSIYLEIRDRDEPKDICREMQERIGAERERAEYFVRMMGDNHTVMLDALTREEVQLAGLWREWGEERLARAELEDFHQHARDAEDEFAAALKEQQRFLYPHIRHLAARLVLAWEANRDLWKELMILLDMLDRIEQVAEHLRDLTQQTLLLELLLSFQHQPFNKRIASRIEQRSSDVHGLIVAIGLSLKQAAYPFRDSKAKRLMDYLLAESRSDHSPEGELDRGMDVLTRLPVVRDRVMARLLELAT